MSPWILSAVKSYESRSLLLSDVTPDTPNG